MHAELRGLYSPDVPDMDPATYSPDDPECFSLSIGAFIGPNEPPLGEELFEFNVCTVTWLAAHPPPKGFEFMRSTILLTRWHFATIQRAIGDLCFHTVGANWGEIARKLKPLWALGVRRLPARLGSVGGRDGQVRQCSGMTPEASW